MHMALREPGLLALLVRARAAPTLFRHCAASTACATARNPSILATARTPRFPKAPGAPARRSTHRVSVTEVAPSGGDAVTLHDYNAERRAWGLGVPRDRHAGRSLASWPTRRHFVRGAHTLRMTLAIAVDKRATRQGSRAAHTGNKGRGELGAREMASTRVEGRYGAEGESTDSMSSLHSISRNESLSEREASRNTFFFASENRQCPREHWLGCSSISRGRLV